MVERVNLNPLGKVDERSAANVNTQVCDEDAHFRFETHTEAEKG